MEFGNKKLLIATPAYSGWLHSDYVKALLQTHGYMERVGIAIRALFLCQCARITKARNDIIQNFMDSEFDYLLMIDADIGWQPDGPARLIRHNVPFVGAVTVKRGTQQMCLRNIDPDSRQFDYDAAAQLLRVASIGTAFMLLRRDAIEAMERAYPNLRLSGEKGGHPRYGLFSEMVTPTGNDDGEDYSFCERWRAIGGEIFVDPFIHLSHIGETTYRGALSDEMKLPAQPPVQEAAD